MPIDSISPLESKAPLQQPINNTAASQSTWLKSLPFRNFAPLLQPRNLNPIEMKWYALNKVGPFYQPIKKIIAHISLFSVSLLAIIFRYAIAYTLEE